MLITLRNSGAESIQYSNEIEDETLMKILKASESESHLHDIFLKSRNLDSFVLDKDSMVIEFLHMNVEKDNWNNTPPNYQIIIKTTKGEYRLNYKAGYKPDFFKKLFKFIYPEIAEKQVEELV